MKVINDAIHGDFSIDGVREELLATPEMNKLSHIKQLGLAHLVFPGRITPDLNTLSEFPMSVV